MKNRIIIIILLFILFSSTYVIIQFRNWEKNNEPIDEDINENPVPGNGMDKDGYVYSYNADRPPIPKVDFDLKQFFPAEAKAANITNKIVVVMVQIDETGALKSARVVSEKAGYGFDEAALEIVKRAKFTPGYINQKPVKMAHRVPVNFDLEE